MSEPIRLVTLTGDLNQVVGGLPATGWVLISSYKTVRAPGANVVIVTQPKPVQLVDGRFAVLVPVSTQVTFEEQCLIEVQILLEDTRPDALVLVVETDADTLDIADAVRLPVAFTDTSIPVVPWRSVGAPGGVAPLGPDGRVPAQFLSAGGGGSPWLMHTQSVPQSVFDVVHGFGRQPAAVTLHSLDLAHRYQGFGVAHPDVNTVRISMDVPTACVALIS